MKEPSNWRRGRAWISLAGLMVCAGTIAHTRSEHQSKPVPVQTPPSADNDQLLPEIASILNEVERERLEIRLKSSDGLVRPIPIVSARQIAEQLEADLTIYVAAQELRDAEAHFRHIAGTHGLAANGVATARAARDAAAIQLRQARKTKIMQIFADYYGSKIRDGKNEDEWESMRRIIDFLEEDRSVLSDDPLKLPEVIGSKDFEHEVNGSLDLLRQKDPSSLRIICRYIGRIEQSATVGMDSRETPLTFHLSPGSAYYSTTWCAGCIVHDACHSAISHLLKREHRKTSDQMTDEELICNARQARAMRRIGASESEVQWIEHADGKHWDMDGDGKFTWNDVRLRTEWESSGASVPAPPKPPDQ